MNSQYSNHYQPPNVVSPVNSRKKKRAPAWRIIGIITVFLLGAIIALLIDYRAIYDWVLGFSYEPSSAISQAIFNIELTERGERIVKASFAELQDSEDFNRNCPAITAETSVLGCYYNWHIYIFDVKNNELDGIKEAVLAHELLHADWQRERGWIKNELEPLLRQTYMQNKDELSEHMAAYSEANFVDELHSVIGTQLDIAKLPQRLRNHYGSIFRNHAKIVKYYKQYNGKFTKLKQEMEELAAKIDQLKEEIEKRTSEYRKKSHDLSTDIDSFNRRAANGYYTSQWAFDNDRAMLVSRQKALDDDYRTLSDLVNKVNKYISDYNQNVTRSSELYDSINSNIEKVNNPTK